MNSDTALQLMAKQLETNTSSVSKYLNRYYERLASKKGFNSEDLYNYLSKEYRSYLFVIALYGIVILSILFNYVNHSGDLVSSAGKNFSSKISILEYLHSNMSMLLYLYSIFLFSAVWMVHRLINISKLMIVTRNNALLTKLMEDTDK